MQNGMSFAGNNFGRDRAGPQLVAVIGKLMAPVPLFPLQLLLSRMVRGVANQRQELFARLGPHVRSSYAIDVQELPFILVLRPDPQKPELTAHRRWEHIGCDARITGPFMELFRIIDGRGDSDAMFFAGNIGITGNTEAAVCLRNALDDLEGSVVDDLLNSVGPFLLPARLLLHRLRELERQS